MVGGGLPVEEAAGLVVEDVGDAVEPVLVPGVEVGASDGKPVTQYEWAKPASSPRR